MLIVVFTVAEGGPIKPTVAGGRRLDLFGCSKQKQFFLCMSLTEIAVKFSFSICVFRYCSPNQYRVPTKIVYFILQNIL